MITALIPARGGSKGIPRKNLVDVCGKPLVAWSINQALQSDLVTRVVVSSDCRNIGAVANACGAEWLERPENISGDTATTETAIAHFLDHYKPSLVVLLQPTSPIRQPDDIDNAIGTYRKASADSLFSACDVEGYTWQDSAIGALHPNYDPDMRERRQERGEQTIEENGSIYVFSPQIFRRFGNRLGGRVATYKMHRLDSYQVDTPDDLELVRSLLPIRMREVVPC